jgi:UDPglucose 6-dehydrogenase
VRFTTEPDAALARADVIFICVGTPARANGEANLLAVEEAARTVARHARPGAVVVEKSTVPAGTADRVRRTLMHLRPDIADDIEVVSNPEFLREGTALFDALQPDRILIGASSQEAFEVMRRLYDRLIAQGSALIETDVATAELAKHACNAFLALKISYANALARICERAGADVVAVTNVMGTDPRIGPSFLQAGLGYGGYCFPKDLVAFQRLAQRLDYDFALLGEVAKINEEAVATVCDTIRDALWNLENKRVAVFGLAFKPGTDDVRFSPALALVRDLAMDGAMVVGYDPEASANAAAEVPELVVVDDPYVAAKDADLLVVATEWPEFRELDLPTLKNDMRQPIVVDGRNIFDPERMAAEGFIYYPVGRAGPRTRVSALHR